MPRQDFIQRFEGIARVYGRDALEHLQKARFCIVGVGGVGSWAAEAAARSGIGYIALIDHDELMISIGRMGVDRDVVELLLDSELRDREHFESPEKLEKLTPKLEALGHKVVSTVRDEEPGLYETIIRSGHRGQREYRVRYELVHTVEFRKLDRLRPSRCLRLQLELRDAIAVLVDQRQRTRQLCHRVVGPELHPAFEGGDRVLEPPASS